MAEEQTEQFKEVLDKSNNNAQVEQTTSTNNNDEEDGILYDDYEVLAGIRKNSSDIQQKAEPAEQNDVKETDIPKELKESSEPKEPKELDKPKEQKKSLRTKTPEKKEMKKQPPVKNDGPVIEDSGSVSASQESEDVPSSSDERINCRLEMQIDFQSFQTFKFLAIKKHTSVKNLILENLSPEFKRLFDKTSEFLKSCDGLGF